MTPPSNRPRPLARLAWGNGPRRASVLLARPVCGQVSTTALGPQRNAATDDLCNGNACFTREVPQPIALLARALQVGQWHLSNRRHFNHVASGSE